MRLDKREPKPFTPQKTMRRKICVAFSLDKACAELLNDASQNDASTSPPMKPKRGFDILRLLREWWTRTKMAYYRWRFRRYDSKRNEHAKDAMAMAWAIHRGDVECWMRLRRKYGRRLDWIQLANQAIMRLVEVIEVSALELDTPAGSIYNVWMNDLRLRDQEGSLCATMLEEVVERAAEVTSSPEEATR
jgi:hypothetical protein